MNIDLPVTQQVLHSHQRHLSFSGSTSTSTLGIISLMSAILVGVLWYPKVVLICISLMKNNIEHIYTTSFVKCLLNLMLIFFHLGYVFIIIQ